MRGVWIVGAVLIAFGVLADSQPLVPCPVKAAGPVKQTVYSNQTNAGVGNIGPLQCNTYINQPDSTEKAANKSNDSPTDWTLWLGIATLAVLIFQAWIYSRQAGIMRRQADISEKQIKISQDQVRAFICIDHPNAIPGWHPDDQSLAASWIFQVTVKNCGMTRAENVVCGINHQFFPEGIPDGFNFPDDPWEKIYTSTVVAQQALTQIWSAEIPVARLKETNFFSRTQNIFLLWGWIDWIDIFNPEHRPRTEFCFEISNNGLDVSNLKTIPEGTLPFVFRNYARHNRYHADYKGPRPY